MNKEVSIAEKKSLQLVEELDYTIKTDAILGWDRYRVYDSRNMIVSEAMSWRQILEILIYIKKHR